MHFVSLTRTPLAALFATAICTAPALAQSTWYVDAAGTPPGSGTPADPYTSIQFAVDQVATLPGDTLEIGAGTYVESVLLHKQLTLRGTDGPAVTILRPSAPGPVLLLDNAGMTPIEGLTITGASDPLGDGISVKTATTALVSRCILRDNERHGLFGVYDVFVDRTTAVRNGASSLTVAGFLNSLTITHSILVDNGQAPDLGGGFGTATWNLIDQGPLGDVFGDPRFWNAAANDFELRTGSAAIDSGSNAVPDQDPDGSPADLGALTFDPAHPPAPVVYCTARINSQGCTPAIAASGTASLSGTPFDITCTQVLNNKSGLFFYGYDGKASPFQGGYLCVQAPAKRTAVQSSGGNPPPDDCSGLYSFDFAAHLAGGTDPALVAGASVYGQYWYRDPANSGFSTGRSDAVYFRVDP